MKVVNKYNKVFLVDEENGKVYCTYNNKLYTASCREKDEFDADFGVNLVNARTEDNLELEQELINKRHCPEAVIKIQERERLLSSNIHKIFGINLPNEQYNNAKLTVKIENNMIIVTYQNDLFPFEGIGKTLITDTPDLKLGIAISELKARSDYNNKVVKIMGAEE